MYSIWFDLINQNGDRPIFPENVSSPGFRYWGEPAAGIYRSSDEHTINRHADEMENLGLDFIFIDLSNSGLSDPYQLDATERVLDVYERRLLEGKPSPKITVLLNIKTNNEIVDLYNKLYSNYNQNIFFQIGGKPLILVYGECDEAYSEKFHCQITWGLDSAKEWSFMDTTPQQTHYNFGWSEEIPVSAAQQKDFMNSPSAHGRKFNYLTSKNDGVEGQNLRDQWSEAYNTSATYVLVKAYNEWASQKLEVKHSSACFMEYCFVDAFNREFSTDIEPMKECTGLGCDSHGSFYYDEMKNYITKFKSTAANLVLRNSQTGLWSFKFGRGSDHSDILNYSDTFSWASGSHYQMLTADFNGDGLNDISLRDTTSGRWYFAFNNGKNGYHNTRNFDWANGSHYQPIVGDFNNDGKTDIALRDTSNGRWHFAFFNGSNWYHNTRNFDWASGSHYQPVSGDFNGDGKTDIAMRDSSNGRWHFSFFNGNNWYYNTRNYDWVKGAHYQAITGDFNCDNKLDIGLRDTSTGNIFLTRFDGSSKYFNEHNYKWNAGQHITVAVDPNQCGSL